MSTPVQPFIEQKSERSVMPQDTEVGRNVVLDGLDFASLRRVWEQTFGATPPSSLSRVFLRRVLLHSSNAARSSATCFMKTRSGFGVGIEIWTRRVFS